MTQPRGATAAFDPTGIAPNGGWKSGPVQEVRVQLSKPTSRRKRRKFRWDFNGIRLDGNVEAGSPEGFVRS
jgi:hypothetical protein